jgi:hypothetical protein
MRSNETQGFLRHMQFYLTSPDPKTSKLGQRLHTIPHPALVNSNRAGWIVETASNDDTDPADHDVLQYTERFGI